MFRASLVRFVVRLPGADRGRGGGAAVLGVHRPPVAVDETTYTEFGRAFPDPHGCVRGLPGKSPWAKGNVCAAQFIQWDEAIDGLRFLEQRFPRYLKLIDLRTQFGDHPECSGLDLMSAGLPREDLSRDRRDLYVVS